MSFRAQSRKPITKQNHYEKNNIPIVTIYRNCQCTNC